MHHVRTVGDTDSVNAIIGSEFLSRHGEEESLKWRCTAEVHRVGLMSLRNGGRAYSSPWAGAIMGSAAFKDGEHSIVRRRAVFTAQQSGPAVSTDFISQQTRIRPVFVTQALKMLRVIVCLVVFTACVIQGRAEEETPTADFTEKIPKGGLPSTTQRSFWLKPGQVLEVVDEEGKADFEPVPASGDGVAASTNSIFDPTKQGSLNAVAYAFKNGACDFSTKINYKDAFKKLDSYTSPLWKPETKQAVNAQLTNSVAKSYTFTNPPANFLDGVVSFCVRFKTPKQEQQSLRSVQEVGPAGGETAYLEVAIHSGAAGLTAKILGFLALTAAGIGKAISL